MSRSRIHRLAACFAVASSLPALAACGGDEGSTDRFDAAERNTAPSSTAESQGGTDGSPDGTTPTTAAADLTPGESLLSGVDAYGQVLGPTVRALRYTQWFPVGDTSYAELQYQVPENPGNVDERDWRNAEVSEPEPVILTLSPGATLEENLFTMSEINWPAVASAMPGAPDLVAQKLGTTLENSDGVTHIIATKDLPFSSNTVVRVYVDGGDRTMGGYVQYFADGTLDKVQA